MQIRTKNNAWGYMIPKYLSDSSISNKSSFFFLSETNSRINKDNKNKSFKKNFLENESGLYNNYKRLSNNHGIKLPILIKDIQINDIYNNTNYIKKNIRLKKNIMSFPSLHIVNMEADLNKKSKTSYFQFQCMNKLFKSRISRNKIENKRILLSGKKINYNNTTIKPKIKLSKPKYISRKMDFLAITNL